MPCVRIALRGVCILLAAACALAVESPENTRSAIFVVGPSAGDGGTQAARSAAFACRRWLKDPGATAELLRAGSSESTPLKATGKELDNAFQAAAKDAADLDPADLISTLDDAVHTLANRPGLKVAVAIADAAPLSSEAGESLKVIVQYASDNGVHIVLLDPSKASLETAGEIWKEAGAATGGQFLQDSRNLATAMLSVSGVKTTAADAEPAPPPRPASPLPANLATDLPVHVRFIQISNRPGGSQSITAQLGIDSSGSGYGGNVGESASRAEGVGGPLHGYLIAQAPLNALHFDKDDRTGSYSAHAKVTMAARYASGKKNGEIAWSQSKDVKINGTLAKFHEREISNLLYLREVSLPAGKYTLESTVEDLLAKKTGSISEPLKTGYGVPGLMVSDPLFVRWFKGNADKFESDTVLNYEGNGFTPLLDPVFPANTPFKVDAFLILYPDVYGPQPTITMEIIRDGKVVAAAQMPFKTKLRNDAVGGKGVGSSEGLVGELQHGFDYVASMNVDKMSPCDCQAKVTVQQGKSIVTRMLDFKVADTGEVAKTAAAPTPSN